MIFGKINKADMPLTRSRKVMRNIRCYLSSVKGFQFKIEPEDMKWRISGMRPQENRT